MSMNRPYAQRNYFKLNRFWNVSCDCNLDKAHEEISHSVSNSGDSELPVDLVWIGEDQLSRSMHIFYTTAMYSTAMYLFRDWLFSSPSIRLHEITYQQWSQYLIIQQVLARPFFLHLA